VAAAYAAAAKFDDPSPGKSNGPASVAWRVRLVCDRTLIFHADVAESSPVARDESGLPIGGSHWPSSQSIASSLDGGKDQISPAIDLGRPRQATHGAHRRCHGPARERDGLVRTVDRFNGHRWYLFISRIETRFPDPFRLT